MRGPRCPSARGHTGLAKLPGVCAGSKGGSGLQFPWAGDPSLSLCPRVNRVSVYRKARWEDKVGSHSQGRALCRPEGPLLSPQLDSPRDTGQCHGQNSPSLHPSVLKASVLPCPRPSRVPGPLPTYPVSHPIIYLPTCPSIHLSFHPPIHLSAHPPNIC